MRLRRLATMTLTALAALLFPASSGADFQTLYNDYRADGVIDGCTFSTADLSSGLTDIPADVREYDPGFSEAINAALEQAAGGCGTAAEEVPTIKNEITAADGSPGPAFPKGLAVASPEGGQGLPAVLIALMVVLGAALGAGVVIGVAHYYGWDLGGRAAPANGEPRRGRRSAGRRRSLRDKRGP
jgi:hypothetical protein